MGALERSAAAAVVGGVGFVLAHQSRDGFWRDYALALGESDAWTTAWIGDMLGRIGVGMGPRTRAAAALWRCARAQGWGYNGKSPPDADSTARAIRFLAAMSMRPMHCAVGLLARYIDAAGAAHTFVESDAGAWGAPHPDVTPVVGLSLLALAAPEELIRRLRARVLQHQQPDGRWRSYWWSIDSYATAHALEFLRASGSIPETVGKAAAQWLDGLKEPCSAADGALTLEIGSALGAPDPQAHAARAGALLDLRLADQSWPPSPCLLVPSKSAALGDERGAPHPDPTRLVSTTLASLALANWLRSRSLG